MMQIKIEKTTQPCLLKKKTLKINFKNVNIMFKKKIKKLNEYCIRTKIAITFSIKIVFNDFVSWIRNLISMHILNKYFPLIFLNSYGISFFTQSSVYLLSRKNLVLFFKSVYEDTGRVRNIFATEIIKNFKYTSTSTNSSNGHFNVVFLLSSQTALIRLFRKFYAKIIFKKSSYVSQNKKKPKPVGFFLVKNGCTIDPADKKLEFSEGSSGIFKCNISLLKSYLLLNLDTKNFHITFISWAKIYKFSKKNFLKTFSNLKFCILDDLTKIPPFDFENFLNIFKKILICRKRSIIFQVYKNFDIEYFSFRLLVILGSFYFRNFNFLTNFGNAVFYLHQHFFLTRKIKKIFAPVFDHMEFIKNTRTRLKEKFFFFINQFNHILKSGFSKDLFIFTQNFFEFILLRNFIWKYQEIGNFQVIALNEYSDKDGYSFRRRKITIVTENFYFFNRNKSRLNTDVIFFSFPSNIEFFFEICYFLHNKQTSFKEIRPLLSIAFGLIYIRIF